MKQKIILIFLIIKSANLFSQGSWNMSYMPMDSVNDTFLQKEIRFDFKSNPQDTFDSKMPIRGLFSSKDTIVLNLPHQKVQVVEKWKIYADHGSLSDQVLESILGNETGMNKIVIKEMYITAFTSSHLELAAFVYYFDNKGILHQERQQLSIPKSLVKGVFFAIHFRHE